ncbi:hypothetical protein EDC96DRAFT_304782 [Choanephora cucurbitarum]|nr:hypothetical protein EDC96DRAFT_304782 [Choanephora cucurbitarum]
MFNNSPQLTNEREMFYVCVDPHTRKAKMAQDRMVHFTRSDAEIIALLHRWSLDNISQVQAARVVSIGRPILTTQGIYEDSSRYFDYIGMVVGCYPEEGPAHKTNLVLTDFTDNPMPFMDDKGDYRLDIEYTKLLQCTLWDENSVRCPKLESGDYILLRNCTRNEKNRNALEISMHGDRTGSTQSRNRVEILKPSDSRLNELLERKSRYVSTKHNSVKDVASLISWGDDPLRTRVKDLKGHKSLKDIKESQQPGLYLTRAIIRKMSPNNVEDWIVGQCKNCKKFYKEPISLCDTCEGLNVPVFKVVFGIFDGTDQVPLVVFDKEAEMLFSGLSAEE